MFSFFAHFFLEEHTKNVKIFILAIKAQYVLSDDDVLNEEFLEMVEYVCCGFCRAVVQQFLHIHWVDLMIFASHKETGCAQCLNILGLMAFRVNL